MLEELHVAVANSRTTLTKFWRRYVSELDQDALTDLDTAARELRYHQDILRQVLDLRAQARRIEGILDTQPLKGLHEKEN